MADVIVLGAGMVGVCSALALQGRGHRVMLVDRRGVAQETSYGNAGILQSEAVEPYAFPLEILGTLKRGLGLSPDIHWTLRGLTSWVGPVLRYAYYSRPSSYEAITRSYAQMISEALPAHDKLIIASGAQDLVTKEGWHQAYRTERAFERAQRSAHKTQSRFGVEVSVLSGAEIAAREPNLQRDMAGALHWSGAWTCQDPAGLAQKYMNLFTAAGGTFHHTEVTALAQAGAGWRVTTRLGGFEAAHVVVALGPWSGSWLQPYLPEVRFVPKRGYHHHFATAEGPRLAFMDAERATFLSPMHQGLRVLTGAELGAENAVTAGRQIRRSIQSSKELFRLGKAVEAKSWSGVRPCMPDMLPRIGAVAGHKGLWVNTGHGHQGFTLGPASAERLARAFEGK